MNRLLIAASALALSASLAGAADLPARNLPVRAAPLPVFTWTGFFVGAHVGGAWGKTSVTETPICPTPVCPSEIDHFSGMDGGFVGGVQAGANYQIGAIVLGILGDLAATSYSNKVVFPCCAPDYVEVEKRWEGSVRARLGYAIDRVLLYVTGGIAFGDFRYKYVTHGANTIDVDTFSKTRTGWILGGGVEYAFGYNWSLFGEYRYTDYGRVTNIPPSYATPFSERHRDTEHGVRVGVNYRF